MNGWQYTQVGGLITNDEGQVSPLKAGLAIFVIAILAGKVAHYVALKRL